MRRHPREFRGPPVSRRWNRSGRVCGGTSVHSRRVSRAASLSGMITDRNTCRSISKRRSRSSALKTHQPSFGHRRATAAPDVFIWRLKENLLWVRHFETIEELRQALLMFRDTYNTACNLRVCAHGTDSMRVVERIGPNAA